MDIAHHKPAPAPTTLTGYQHEILRRIDERGTVRSITRNLPGPIVDGVWTEVDRLWSWHLSLRNCGCGSTLAVDEDVEALCSELEEP